MGWVDRCMAIAAGVAVIAGVSVLVARSEVPGLRGSATVSLATTTPEPRRPSHRPQPPAPTKAVPAVETSASVGAVTFVHEATLRSGPSMSARGKRIVGPGVLAPVLASKGSYYHVLTP